MDQFIETLPAPLQNVWVLAAAGIVVLILLAVALRALVRRDAASPAPAGDEAPAPEVPAGGQALDTLPGISDAQSERLRRAGAGSVEALARLADDAHALGELAAAAQLEDFVVRRYAGIAGLMQLPGMSSALADALVKNGVRSVSALAAENPDRVQNKLAAWEEKHEKLGGPPSRADVAQLIESAASA